MEENKITITLNEETAAGLARINLPDSDMVKLRIYEAKKLLAQAQADVDKYKAELIELRK